MALHEYEAFNYSGDVFYSDNPILTEALEHNGTLSSTSAPRSILEFLLQTAPEYIKSVPKHWLKQDLPPANGQTYLSIAFLIIGIPAHLCHIVVFLAYAR